MTTYADSPCSKCGAHREEHDFDGSKITHDFVTGPPMSDAKTLGAAATACRICGEPEPSHVHNDGKRIEHYFTVGRGESDFMAALRWRDLAEAREAELAEARRLLRDIYRYWVAADEPWRTPIYGFWESVAAFLARTDTQEEKK